MLDFTFGLYIQGDSSVILLYDSCPICITQTLKNLLGSDGQIAQRNPHDLINK
jgi:hypothetical protein